MKTATEDFTVKSGKVYRPILDTDGSIWKRRGAKVLAVQIRDGKPYGAVRYVTPTG